MAEKAKHAYGSRANLEEAIASGKVDAFDVLFLSGENEKPAMGWVSKDGEPIIIESADTSALESEIAMKADASDLAAVEAELAEKANIADVDAKLEAALAEHLTKKYEIADAPTGTLVDYRENEIRIMCPIDAEYHLQSVGSNGDANTYYVTLKTYIYDDNVVGYKERLGEQIDAEILTDLKTDKYGRRYQPTWLGVAKYDETTNAWTYYGANSTTSKYIGWNYQIDWYDADGVMIASDCVRINLSNEECHSSIKPYYGVSETEDVDVKIDEAVESANAYTDAQIEAKLAEIEAAVSYEIVEF